MRKILDILKEIKNTKGTNDKILILSNEKENKELLEVLDVVYNPKYATNLALKKINKVITKEVEFKAFRNDREFIIYLKNCGGKDADILAVQNYINTYENEEDRELLKEIACQTLSVGLDIKNINKALGYRFIDIINPMKAYNVEKHMDKIKDTDMYYITKKLDGNRVLIRIEEGNMIAYSGNGLILEGYDDFLNNLDLPKGYFYDGELLPSNVAGLCSKEQYKEISKITRTKGTKDKDKICFNIFDMIPIEEFLEGESKLDYSARRGFMDILIRDTKYQKLVKVIMKHPINSEVFELLDKVTDEGEEGLMANLSTGKYQGKRTYNILKFKKFNDIDLKCIGVEEGEGKYKGKLGKITVEYLGNTVGVGTGFSDSQRDYYINNPEEIIGKIVKVKYFEETKDESGNPSLRFPVFIEIRTDKNEPSYE